MKKRAKQTERINYGRKIWEHVAINQARGRTKDQVCIAIKGNRKVVFRDINKLIEAEILEYENGKLTISTKNNLEVKRRTLEIQLKNFVETRKNTIEKIKDRIKKSPLEKRAFFYQEDFRYTKPSTQTMEEASRNSSKEVEKHIGTTEIDFLDTEVNKNKKGDVEYITTKIYHINDYAKQWIFMIPQLLDGVVRCSFSLYVSQMLKPVSNTTYREIFEVDIKKAINEITKTRKMLLDLMLQFSKNEKEDTKFFDQWWDGVTYGLAVESDPRLGTKLGLALGALIYGEEQGEIDALDEFMKDKS